MSLKIWLPLNGSTINQGLSQTHTITNNSATLNASGGKITANCATFSSGNYITISNANTIIPINQKQVSIAFWMKSTNTENQCLFCNRTQTGYGISIFKLNKTQFRFDTGGGSGMTTFSGLKETYSNWTHFCFTWDGKIKKLYVDGINVSSATCENDIDNYGNKIYLGISCSNTDTGADLGNKFIGSLNDYRIYDHCLSPREVKLLAQGLVAHYKLDKPTGKINYVKGASKYTYHYPLIRNANEVSHMYDSYIGHSTSDIHVIVPENGDYTWILSSDGIPSGHNPGNIASTGKCFSMWLYNDTAHYLWSNFGTGEDGKHYGLMSGLPAGTYTIRTNLYANDNINYTLKFWNIKLIKGNYVPWDSWSPYSDSLIECDCSGYGNHGTESASLETGTDSPRYSYSTIFDNNKYIKIPARSYEGMKDTYTFSYWAKNTNMSQKMVWGFSDGNRLNIYPYSWFNWNTGDSADNPFMLNNNNIFFTSYNRAWHYYTITGDGNKTTLYIDGNMIGIAKTYRSITGTQIYISGWDANNNYKWNDGQISDFRIYATALSAAAVKELYESSISFLDNGTLQCSEMVEKDTNLKYNKNGAVQINKCTEVKYKMRDLMPIKTLDSDNSHWARIYWLDVTNVNTYFKDINEAQHCITETNRFSMLDTINYFFNSGLPSGYTRLEYIQPGGSYGGSPYIDTGFVPNGNTKIVLSYAHNLSDEFGALFGARIATTSNVFGAWIGDSDSYYPHYGNNGYDAKTINGIPLNSQRIYVMDKNSHTVYGTNNTYTRLSTNSNAAKSSSHTFTNFTASCTLALFSIHTNNSYDERRARGKLYACQIYDNGTLVRDFIPCKNPNGIIGLYDMVNQQFYTKHNSSDPDFITGNMIYGHLEFMLTYPKLSANGYNRWRQTSTIDNTTVDNFFPITATWSARNGGLCLSPTQTNTIYDCDAHQSNWFAPVGQIKSWDSNAIPAADGTSSTTETELWIRIHEPLKNKILSMSNNQLWTCQIYEL